MWSILVQDVVHVDEDHPYLIHPFVMLHQNEKRSSFFINSIL